MARRAGSWKPPQPTDFTWYLWEDPIPKWGTSGRLVMLEDGTDEMLHRLLDPAVIIPGRTLWRPIPDSHNAPLDPFRKPV